ncbi:cystine transport system substrate-binding protein [Trichococcus patagoniensis]|uniref:Cystine transport system substrate-binding protein n=1 Tax=Trichococcus patagoniensis TaxID=382641 RepID=A0A2T5IBP0_9LACT|nr:3D domain-containing protein [Trichococcus patagoniensis]PTQ81249.1 cystine transport system substrate-binding protein [Trichococcus patagoniensis]
MNHRKRIGKLMLAGLAASLTLSITQVQGSTLDTLTQEEKQTEAQIASVEVTIGETLASINLKKMGIDDLKAQIVATEESQIETRATIEAQKEVIASRKEQLKTRLVALQTSDATTNQILMLIDSKNFADFINRAYVVGQLQAADNEQIESAISEEEKLTALEEQLADEIQTVKAAESRLKSESTALAEELTSLKSILSDNQTVLSQVKTEYADEAARLAAEEAQAKADAEAVAVAAKAAEEQQVAVAESASSASVQESAVASSVQAPVSQITDSSVAAVETAPVVTVATPTVTETPAAQGKTLVVSATAYSRHEAGLSNFTATGIDLSVNPMVIAVDPSVIPLGSLVSVPGYGIAIAGDTGGAIIGNKIDLHMEDLNAALAFGRQTLTITILQ